jgi:hypothetical protein
LPKKYVSKYEQKGITAFTAGGDIMLNQACLSIENNSMKQLKGVYTLGFISTFIIILFTILDIIIGISLGANLSQNTVERYNQFHQNWLIGLYNLDMLNLITTIIMILTYYALYIAQRNLNSNYIKFSFLLFIIAAAIFIANNSALPMYDLSRKYFATNVESQKLLYAAAGEALLARVLMEVPEHL